MIWKPWTNNTTQRERLYNYFDAVDFTVYADFNCPFSYVLNERIFALNLEYRVDFRLVQHLPDTKSDQVTIETLSALTAEVAEVRRRAPSAEISVPMFRPNSAPASALVYKISKDDPVQATQLRQRIFRALWVEGKDISDAELLASILLELDIVLESTRVPLNSGELTAWQSEWANNTEFEKLLPVAISESGETAIGPLLEPELDAFLETGSLVSGKMASSLWPPLMRQRILVLENDAKSLRTIVEQMHDAQVEVAEDLIGLISHTRNLGMPDLLVVNTDFSGKDWWRNLTNLDPDPAVPMIHVLSSSAPAVQAKAFASGASDVITRPFSPKLLRSRLNTHLHKRRLHQQINSISRVDALTSVFNRREFDARLSAEWGRSARADETLALLMIDVDKLKEYNDRYGHLSGDDCLIKVTQLISGCLKRSADIIARYEGGCFVALLPGVSIESAFKIGRNCYYAIADAKIYHSESTLASQVSVSVGVAGIRPSNQISSSLLVEQAETAIYQAKRQAHERIYAFDAV